MTKHLFLSDDWIAAARDLRARYASEMPEPPAPVRLNVVVTDIGHRDGDLHGHIDSTAGQIAIEEGHLDDPELTITLDYATARLAFIDRDPQGMMQAFLAGKIFMDGDASKLLALQAAPPEPNPLAEQIYTELRAFTADDE